MAFLIEKGIAQIGWDPAREMSRDGKERAEAPLGPLAVQVTVSELEREPEVLCDVYEGYSNTALAIVTDEEYPTRKSRAEQFVRAMELILPNKPEGHLVLHIEEAGLLEGDTTAETVEAEIATSWRKEGVTPVFYTQAISQVPDRARRQVRRVVAYSQVDRWDRQAMSDLVTPRFARAVRKLKQHQCLYADRLNTEAWDEDAPEGPGAESAA